MNCLLGHPVLDTLFWTLFCQRKTNLDALFPNPVWIYQYLPVPPSAETVRACHQSDHQSRHTCITWYIYLFASSQHLQIAWQIVQTARIVSAKLFCYVHVWRSQDSLCSISMVHNRSTETQIDVNDVICMWLGMNKVLHVYTYCVHV